MTFDRLITSLPDLQGEISGADAIIIGIAHNSFPLNGKAPCGSPVDSATGTIQDWSTVDEVCAARASKKSRPVYDELYSTVAGWRAGKPTILLFNGADGSKPSADLFADDYTHPSQLGNDEIVRLLTERGFAPLG